MQPPPQNTDYECSIIHHALIGDQKNIELACDELEPSHFYASCNQVVWECVKSMVKVGDPVEMVTLAARLKDTGKLREAGGSDGLLKILEEHYPASDFQYYVTTIRQLAAMRETIERCNAVIKRACGHCGDYKGVIDFAQQQMATIDCGGDEKSRKVSDLILDAFDRYGKQDENRAIKTGFYELDTLLPGGFRGSKLIIIAARPSVGKTSMLLSMARYQASRGHRVGVFSLEMDADELIDRLVAMETGINTVKLAGGRLSEAEWKEVTEAGSRISSWKLRIDDQGGLSIGELRRRCRRMIAGGAEIIYIDQLSKITGGEGRSEYEKRSDIVNQLSALKKDVRIPICLLAQINRMTGTDPPTLSHLKSTGSLEEDADIVLLGHRRYPYTKEIGDMNHAQWELAKHRGGPTRLVKLWWEPKQTLFTNLPQETNARDYYKG